MSTLSDFMLTQLNNHGWMSISSIFIDNSIEIYMNLTNGEICISPSNELMFFTTSSDTTTTNNIIYDYVRILGSRNHNEMTNNITVCNFDQIQHISLAMYAWRSDMHANVVDNTFDMPNVPTKAALDALVLSDPDNNIYTGTDTITDTSGRELSALALYDDTKGHSYSGAVVQRWKEFYSNQDKFKTMIAGYTTFSDLI